MHKRIVILLVEDGYENLALIHKATRGTVCSPCFTIEYSKLCIISETNSNCFIFLHPEKAFFTKNLLSLFFYFNLLCCTPRTIRYCISRFFECSYSYIICLSLFQFFDRFTYGFFILNIYTLGRFCFKFLIG